MKLERESLAYVMNVQYIAFKSHFISEILFEIRGKQNTLSPIMKLTKLKSCCVSPLMSLNPGYRMVYQNPLQRH